MALPRTLLAAGAALLAAGTADAASLVALTLDNHLVRLDSETRRAAAPVRVTGTDSRLLGIDQRPADGKLYGLTERGQIVTIDLATGRATEVARLNTAFESGGRAVIDFNPVADRLRVMGMSGQNLRVNVATGEAARDGQLKYQQGGAFAETTPRITGGAYTNSIAGAQQTALYTLDTLAGQLNLQAPPNDGVQQPRAALSMPLPAGVALDIAADGNGGNMAFVLAGGALMTLDLANGMLAALGPVAGLPASETIDVAVMR